MYARKPIRSRAKIKWQWGQREMQDEDHKVWVKVMSFVLMLFEMECLIVFLNARLEHFLDT